MKDQIVAEIKKILDADKNGIIDGKDIGLICLWLLKVMIERKKRELTK